MIGDAPPGGVAHAPEAESRQIAFHISRMDHNAGSRPASDTLVITYISRPVSGTTMEENHTALAKLKKHGRENICDWNSLWFVPRNRFGVLHSYTEVNFEEVFESLVYYHGVPADSGSLRGKKLLVILPIYRYSRIVIK